MTTMPTAAADAAADPDSAGHANPYADGAAYIEGRYVPIAEARLPVLDWGFTRSDVTYDVVHVWKGSFFRLEDHLDRFERSCATLRLVPPAREEVREILMQCVRLSGLRDAYVELTCTRGVPAPGSRDPRTCKNNFLAFAIPFVWVITPEQQARGAHLIISKVPRIPPASVDPTVKNFHWGDLTKALFEACDQGADTAVLVDMEGYVAEGPGFNVFCIKNGTVRSPGSTVLEGITRRSVRELCEALDIHFELGRVTPDELRNADEVFLSTTAGGIMPVSRVDDNILGDGHPGPLATRLKDLYWAKHEQGWHGTPVDYCAV
jgi:branched-chain amino acid aminotransferase